MGPLPVCSRVRLAITLLTLGSRLKPWEEHVEPGVVDCPSPYGFEEIDRRIKAGDPTGVGGFFDFGTWRETCEEHFVVRRAARVVVGCGLEKVKPSPLTVGDDLTFHIGESLVEGSLSPVRNELVDVRVDDAIDTHVGRRRLELKPGSYDEQTGLAPLAPSETRVVGLWGSRRSSAHHP